MRRLSWFIDRLPGVHPRLTSAAIKDGSIPGVMEDIHFLHGERGCAMLVGPDAARLILDAYRNRALIMKIGAIPVEFPPAAAYLDQEDQLREEASKHRLARAGSDPFADWRSMEEIFQRSGHPISTALEVGGVLVRRCAVSSRNTRPETISFSWNAEDGHDVRLRHRNAATAS